jgi:LysM repeat protein
MVQNPANADAAARGATAGNLAPMENQALAVRQALTGSFVAQQTAQNAAQQTYADTMANVVAPGQKLGAMAQQAGKAKLAQDDITQTARERGADETVYRADRKSDEAKQILALQIDGSLPPTRQPTTTLAQQRIKETHAHNQADESEAAKKRRADQRKADSDAAAKGHQPNQYGVPADQWAKWSSSHRQRVIDASKASSAKPKTLTPQQKYEQDFFKKYHVRPQSTAEVAKTREQRFPAITKALSDLQRANKRGKKLTLDEAGRLLTVGQPAGEIVITNKNKDLYPGEKVGSKHKTRKVDAYPAVLIRVIMDQQRMNGYISAATANRLHRSGTASSSSASRRRARRRSPPAPATRPARRARGWARCPSPTTVWAAARPRAAPKPKSKPKRKALYAPQSQAVVVARGHLRSGAGRRHAPDAAHEARRARQPGARRARDRPRGRRRSPGRRPSPRLVATPSARSPGLAPRRAPSRSRAPPSASAARSPSTR